MAEPRAVALPPESRIAPRYAGAHLADAFAIALPARASGDILKLANALVGKPAPWIDFLVRMRDLIVAPLGLKTTVQVRADAIAVGIEHVGFFPLLERHETEAIAGENDKHLDFRASILLRPTAAGGGRELVVTTVVHCHNWLGHSYLFLITPFHRLIVKAHLRDAARHGWPD